MLLFTDGIFEIEGCDQDGCHGEYGEDRLMAAVSQRLHLPPGELFDELLADARHFSGCEEFEDDVCLLGMEVMDIGAGT